MTGDSTGVTVIVTPPPTPNGPLHLGHLSGPYLAADVAARVARARGQRVVTMTGVDYYQNYVLARARAADQPVEAVAAHYIDQIREAFDAARIHYDVFIDPARDAAYRQAVTDLFTGLLDTGELSLEPGQMAGCDGCGRTMHHSYVGGTCSVCWAGSNGGTCEGCGAFTSALNLVDVACTGCGGAPRPLPDLVPVLRLEASRARLLEIWSRTDLPPRVWRLIRHYLAVGLPDVVLSYPTDWGIELTEGPVAGHRLDVWAEMAFGYAYGVARAVDDAAVRAHPVTMTACAKAWHGVDRLWFFEGIDNAFYYAIMFPALLDLLGVPSEKIGLVVNEFYRLTGEKFSTSRDHAVWAREFLKEEDPALVRLYLSWDRPDRHQSDFNLTAYREFTEWAAAVLAGEVSVLPPGLAAAELARAEHAVDLANFDSPLAVRCLLAGRAADPARADRLLAAFTGADHGAAA
jgi:methionyl-tRNA synthetase